MHLRSVVILLQRRRRGGAKVQIWLSNVGSPCKYRALVVRNCITHWVGCIWINLNMQKKGSAHLLWACSFLPWVSAWVSTWASPPWRGWPPWPLLAHAQVLPVSGGRCCTDAASASSWLSWGSQDLNKNTGSKTNFSNHMAFARK